MCVSDICLSAPLYPPYPSLLDGSVVAFLRHKFSSGVDIVQLHFSSVGAEEEPLLTLREGDGGERAVLLRVPIRADGAELGVDEFPVETSAVEAAILREGGAIEKASGDGSGRAALVARFRTPMLIEERKGRTNDDRIPTDGVLLPQIVRHDRVQRHFRRLRHQRPRLQFSQYGRREIRAAPAGFLPDEYRRLGSGVREETRREGRG